MKTLNEFLEYNHLKMETIHSVADLIQPHCYMTSIDLKGGYYSVKMSEENSKYVKLYAGKIFLKFVDYQMDCLQVHESLQSSLNHLLHV